MRLITAAGRNGGYYDKQRLVFVAEANPLRAGFVGIARRIALTNSPPATVRPCSRALFRSAFRSATKCSFPN